MSIEDINRRLYKPGENFSDRDKPASRWAPGRSFDIQKTENVKDYWQRPFNKKPSDNAMRNKILKIGGITIAALLILTGLIWFSLGRAFDKEKIVISLEAPERVVAGEEVNFLVKYDNRTKTDLLEARVKLTFPESSFTENGSGLSVEKIIGKIGASTNGEINFTGRLIGREDDIKKVLAVISYQPKNINSRFEGMANAESKIVAVPIVLSFDLPEKIVSGQIVQGALQYTNTSSVSFSDLILKIDFPEDFQLQSAHPESSDARNSWNIFELPAREEGKILFLGTTSGQSNQAKSFAASIGFKEGDDFIVLADGLGSTTISDSPLIVTQSVNGEDNYVAKPGETLKYKVKYKNTAEVGIPAANIVVEFISSALDYSSVSVSNGSYDSQGNKITWNAGGVSKLALVNPGEEGEVSFSVKVLGAMPVENFNDKNFVVKTDASIDTPNVPLSLAGTEIKGTSEMTVKIRTNVNLLTKGYYNDDLIPNSGPIPPRVGQKTTYTIYWNIINTSNDLSDAKVEAVLPNNVEWLDKTSLDNGIIKFDSAVNKVTWTLGKVPAGAGNILPVRVISWQVAITPSSNQVGKVVELIRGSVLTATNQFTNENIKLTGNNLDTGLITDLSSNNDGRVVQ